MIRHAPGRFAIRAAFVPLVIAVAVGATWTSRPAQDGPIFEVRDYHIAPESLADYREWASTHGVAHLKRELDVVGFWVDTGIDPELRTETADPLGSANVTWIIRWDSMEDRAERLGEVFGSAEWRETFSHLPGGLGIYQRIQSRFLSGL